MATMTNFLFGQHLEESKNKLENLQKELNKCVEEFNYFLNNIDAENYSDFNDKAKTFNEELNKIMSDKQNFIVSFTNIVDNKKEVDIDRLNNLTDYHDFNSKGIYKSANGEYAEAIKYYDDAIKLNPNMADAYYNKAVAKTKLGLLKEAIE
nr:tetratricopeptide repeat protein [uncultured Brachyspira sp.]